jgi:S-adenosylmethionine decarboxylase
MQAMRDAAKESQASLIDVWAYKFTPQGVTGVALLKESHITVHTWPEWGYAAVDLFMCGAKADSRKGATFLSESLGAQESVVTEIKRGLKNGTR